MPSNTRRRRRWLAVGAMLAPPARPGGGVFEHLPSKALDHRHDQPWLRDPAIDSPWTAARTLPPTFGRLPADENGTDVRAAASTRVASTVPTVFVSTAPAERVFQRVAPQYEPDRGAVGRTDGGEMFAGRDGNVYRKDGDSRQKGDSWQKYENGSWNSTARARGTSGGGMRAGGGRRR